jgi:nucleotide-binding universal stress UspA family protein
MTPNSILVYLESADAKPLDSIVHFATQHGASITLCRVLQSAAHLLRTPALQSKLEATLWTQAFEQLRELCQRHEAVVDIDYVVLTGSPFMVISQLVAEADYDLVVHISPAETTHVSRVNPTGMHLVRKCPATVLTLNAQQVLKTDTILVAIDRDAQADAQRARDIALRAIETAAQWADSDTAIYLAHIWQPFGQNVATDPSTSLTPEAMNTYVQEVKDDYTQWLQQLLNDVRQTHRGVKWFGILRQGSVCEQMALAADEFSASLLVLGTVANQTNPGVLIGTSAEALLTRMDRPALTLKPKGYTTPLTFRG